MLTFLGYTLVFLALLVSLYVVIRPEAGSQPFLRTAAMWTQSSPFLLLSLSFLFEATSLDLVSSYVGEGLPLFYRISAVWGSRSGPLLMWASMMSVIAWLMSRDTTTDSATVRIIHLWTFLLLLISAGLRPFSPAIPGSAGEISPLLQTDLMVIHPPVVFVYYSLCLATASIAVSGLIRSRPSSETHASMIPWARYSFLAGTIGMDSAASGPTQFWIGGVIGHGIQSRPDHYSHGSHFWLYFTQEPGRGRPIPTHYRLHSQ